MCFASRSKPVAAAPPPALPRFVPRKPEAGLRVQARLRRRRSRGAQANIFTSALGDSRFGAGVVSGATRLGQSNMRLDP